MAGAIEPEPGAFCISELQTADVDGAKRFYGAVFGWTAVDVPAAAGTYSLFQRDGHDVAGLRRVGGVTHRWVPHVYVDALDNVAARAAALGARVATPPRETSGVARTCVIDDPEGATFGLWEAGGHPGARLAEDAGSMWWVELLALDVNAAREFYSALFGWTWFESSKIGFPYTVFKKGDRQVAGAGPREPDWNIVSPWQVLFAIESFATTVKTLGAAGGTLAFWRDVPYNGRFGILKDSGGAVFCIMDPNQVVEPS